MCLCAVLCIVLWCCEIGSSASLRVLGTIHLLPNSEIWLWTKSCLILLSLMNVGRWCHCFWLVFNIGQIQKVDSSDFQVIISFNQLEDPGERRGMSDNLQIVIFRDTLCYQ